MHTRQIMKGGNQQASKALILLHGRGSDANDIMGLSRELNVDGFLLLAPQATNHTWYPYSFLMPQKQNEPWLSSALDLVNEAVKEAERMGIKKEAIYFAGFSQGACLTLEYVARHASKYGGVAAFTGGLIGENVNWDLYTGSFDDTPIFIGSSDPDPHVPVSRVHESVDVLKSLGAKVTTEIYTNMGHTISHDEIHAANTFIFNT